MSWLDELGMADRAGPELAKALARVERGYILEVVRIDHLARPPANLLEVIRP